MTTSKRESSPAIGAEPVHARHVRSPLPARFRTWMTVAAVVACAGALLVWRAAVNAQVDQSTWFAGYVDVTVSPPFPFEDGVIGGANDVTLAFVVADPLDPCIANWGTRYRLDEAKTMLGLEDRIAKLRSRGGKVGVSFGGALNSELANTCHYPDQLRAAYHSVVDRYDPAMIDFDIEGDNLTDDAAGQRRATAVAALQNDLRRQGKTLSVWLTLPVSPNGLTDQGITAVDQMLTAGVQLSGVNIMTMNYGSSRSSSQSMLDAATSAAEATHEQLSIAFQRTGKNLSGEEVWKKLGLTPMIGKNDLPGEVFGLDDASKLNTFAIGNGISRLSMWSLNRDVSCAPGQEEETASHVCSGIEQGDSRFSALLAAGLHGRMH